MPAVEALLHGTPEFPLPLGEPSKVRLTSSSSSFHGYELGAPTSGGDALHFHRQVPGCKRLQAAPFSFQTGGPETDLIGLVPRSRAGGSCSSSRHREASSFMGMEVGEAQAPKDANLVDVVAKCQVAEDSLVSGEAGPASAMNTAIQRETECTEKLAGRVVKEYFGTPLKAGVEAATGGVKYAGDLTLHASDKEHGFASGAQDTCFEFGSTVLHRLDGGQEVKASEISRKDAEHQLRSFSRCMEATGNLLAQSGCTMVDEPCNKYLGEPHKEQMQCAIL